MAKKMTYTDFKNDLLRRLGANFQAVLLTDKQLEMIINDAYTFFSRYHYDGNNKDFVFYAVGERNFSGNTVVLEMPQNVYGVTNVYPLGSISGLSLKSSVGGTAMPLGNIFQGIFGINVFGGGAGCFGLSNLSNGNLPLMALLEQSSEMWRRKMNPTPFFNYRSSENLLNILTDVSVGDVLLIEVNYEIGLGIFEGGGKGSHLVHQRLGSEDDSPRDLDNPVNRYKYLSGHNNYLGNEEVAFGFLSDPLLSEYAFQLCTRQISRNMLRTGTVPHLGGVKTNPEYIGANAQEQIDQIEQKIMNLAIPPAIFMG